MVADVPTFYKFLIDTLRKGGTAEEGMCAQVLPLMQSEKLRLLISASFIFYLERMVLAEGTGNPNGSG